MGGSGADLTIEDAAKLIVSGQLTASELLEDVLARLRLTEPVVHAYAAVTESNARRRAADLDSMFSAGQDVAGPLHGIPVSLKDLISTKGVVTSAGSRALEDYVPATDATVVRHLMAAGAVVVGKAITHEFAYGLNSPPTGNAWEPRLYPGGSSAGSGVSVAVGSALGSLGTDTGGSGRVPAALNGLFALKPTHGAVSRTGVIAMSNSMDAITPMARSAAGCRVLFNAIRGADAVDMSARSTLGAHNGLNRRLTIGVDWSVHFGSTVHREVKEAARTALDRLESLGHQVVSIQLPEAETAVEVGSLIVMVDCSNYHHNLLRSRASAYHQSTRVMLEAGELLPSSAYVEAQRQRQRLRLSVRRTFESEGLDIIAMPTHPLPAVEKHVVENPLTSETDEGFGRTLDHTILANLLGLPAVSIPVGLTKQVLPVGLQLMGRPSSDHVLLDVAQQLEDAQLWSITQRPEWLKGLVNSTTKGSADDTSTG